MPKHKSETNASSSFVSIYSPVSPRTPKQKTKIKTDRVSFYFMFVVLLALLLIFLQLMLQTNVTNDEQQQQQKQQQQQQQQQQHMDQELHPMSESKTGHSNSDRKESETPHKIHTTHSSSIEVTPIKVWTATTSPSFVTKQKEITLQKVLEHLAKTHLALVAPSPNTWELGKRTPGSSDAVSASESANENENKKQNEIKKEKEERDLVGASVPDSVTTEIPTSKADVKISITTDDHLAASSTTHAENEKTMAVHQDFAASHGGHYEVIDEKHLKVDGGPSSPIFSEPLHTDHDLLQHMISGEHNVSFDHLRTSKLHVNKKHLFNVSLHALDQLEPLKHAPNKIKGLEMWDIKDNHFVCRFYASCRMRNGSLILPKWMRRGHSEISRCGVSPIYVLEENLFVSKFFEHHASINREKFIHSDLLALNPLRSHMGHYVSDIMEVLNIFDLYLNPESEKGYRKFLCKLFPKSTKCPSKFLVPVIPLFGDIFMDDEDITWSHSFSQNLLALPFNAYFVHLVEEYDTLFTTLNPEDMICFNSIFATSIPMFDFVSVLNTSAHSFYRTFGLFRLGIFPQGNIPWTIKFLDRIGDRAYIGNRNFTQTIQYLYNTVYSSLQKSNHTIAYNIDVIEFGNSSFLNQVDHMQKADALITMHGAGNANFMFLRATTPVLEVFPFGYYYGPFNAIAQSYGLDYFYVMSKPQILLFERCIREREGNHIRGDELISRYNMAAQHINRSDPMVFSFKRSENTKGRQCARSVQNDIHVNIFGHFLIQVITKRLYPAIESSEWIPLKQLGIHRFNKYLSVN